MAVYEDKFIVLNKKFLENLSDIESNELMYLMSKAGSENDNYYYVVNQDEPYADRVWELISDYEDFKTNRQGYLQEDDTVLHDVSVRCDSGINITDIEASSVKEAAEEAIERFYRLKEAPAGMSIGPVYSCIVKRKNQKGDVYSFDNIPVYAIGS